MAELTGPGVHILTVSATDRDKAENGRLEYSMLPLDEFSINPVTGKYSCLHWPSLNLTCFCLIIIY